jgi:hypothetical protein
LLRKRSEAKNATPAFFASQAEGGFATPPVYSALPPCFYRLRRFATLACEASLRRSEASKPKAIKQSKAGKEGATQRSSVAKNAILRYTSGLRSSSACLAFVLSPPAIKQSNSAGRR